MTTRPDLIVLDPADNVGTALRPVAAGATASVQGVGGPLSPLVVAVEIPFGHKAALVPIRRGELVLKHGRPIGRATRDIGAGEHVHVQNVISLSREGEAGGAG